MKENSKIFIQFFANLKEFFGEKLEIDISEQTKVHEIIEQLIKINKNGQESLKLSSIAINDEMITENIDLKNGDRIFFLPPVSGG